jgi:DNA repair exonuclease SbcCD ATPase subunit
VLSREIISMSVTASSLPPNESQEVIDFLRRLASMLTGGRNADLLLKAASMIEALTRQAVADERLAQEQQDEAPRARELREAAERAHANLTAEIATLKSKLAETTRQAESDRTSFTEDKHRLQAGLEEVKAQLAEANAELDELRKPVTGIDDSIAIVPVESLQLARTQFDFLAAGFAKNNDVISQTICQIGACAMDKALSDNMPAVANMPSFPREPFKLG